MQIKIGDRIGREEVQARWTHAELTGRFAGEYILEFSDPESRALQTKILNGETFQNLNGEEKAMLLHWNASGFRRDFAGLFALYDTFECRTFDKTDLGMLLVPKRIGGGSLLDLLARVEEQDAPTRALDHAFEPEKFEPLVLGHYPPERRLTIWEGNFRACLFHRTADADALIAAWVPVEGRLFERSDAM